MSTAAATTSGTLPRPATTASRAAAFVPLVLVGVIAPMLVPLPPFIIDLMLAMSIALSIALLLIAIHLEKPLDLSAFPTILLFATLFRLAINVASTRQILAEGAQGTAAAGDVIRAFGEFMIQGNYVVGIVIFLILIVINFVVITKGAGRVAEVSARFTLDALPGKQMSIDADLSTGAITQAEAKLRRKEIEQEADFFGAMDGASKFVRGDAIAALLITAVQIVGGFVVGVLQEGMNVKDAAAIYTTLSIGDGLAAQIPALLISTAAAVVVTRSSTGSALGPAMVRQLGGRQSALYVTSGILCLTGLLPGMPLLPFVSLGLVIGLAGRSAAAFAEKPPSADDPGEIAPSAPTEREKLEEMLPIDLLELEVGLDLVPLVEAARGGELVERISAIRRNLATELGIIIPSIHIRDNLRLKAGQYRLLLSGNEIGSGELRVGRYLAMDPTGSLPPMAGEQVREPAFGLPARWVASLDREKAENIGYTVVDAPTVAATHLTEMLRQIAPDLLGRNEAQELFDLFAKRQPRLVDEVIPNLLPVAEVIKILKQLLREQISVRDMRSVLECVADNARETKDVMELTERVRGRLARQITGRFRGEDGRVAALVLDPRAEELFRQGPIDSNAAGRMLTSLDSAARSFAGLTTPPLILCAPDVRRLVSEFLARRIPGLSVLSFREIDAKSTVRTLGVVAA